MNAPRVNEGYCKARIMALSNSRTLLPVEYPSLSSLTSWTDAAAAVGYNYPSAGHQLVYSGGTRLVPGGPNSYACPGAAPGTLGVPQSSCSMYNSWRHAPRSPLSFYYQPDADWILRQSKLDSQPHLFGQHQSQRWKNGAIL